MERNRIQKSWDALWGKDNTAIPTEKPEGNSNIAPKKNTQAALPAAGGYTASINKGITGELYTKMDFKDVLVPGFDRRLIPSIRLLCKFNPDFSQALYDITQLANTGFEIKFDSSVTADKATEMTAYLREEAKTWGDGIAGLTGHVNKMFSQLMVGGAISNEWIVSKDLKRISNVVYLNPEEVAWVREGGRYKPYQIKAGYRFMDNQGEDTSKTISKLNINTYKYLALNGDEDSPYGIPPYCAALESIGVQTDMLTNIKFIMKYLGMMGYLDASVAKPDQNDDENDEEYGKRLNSILHETKGRVMEGMKDGVNVGFKDDHEFEFQSTQKSVGNIDAIWQLNELQLSSGLKFDAAFLGRSYNTTETSITILFTKMLSQLSTLQDIVSNNLEFGFRLALLLGGYKFKTLEVKFSKSTVTDTLKYQQSEEIKIRNNSKLYVDGVISQEQYAKNLGYDSPDKTKPRIPLVQTGTPEQQIKKETRKDQKSKSQKKTIDKKNPQGTIRRQK